MSDLKPVDVQIMKLGSSDTSEAMGALQILKNQGGQVIPALLEQLKSADDSIRTMIVVVLGEIGYEAAGSAEQVAALLLESNEQLRMASALTLTRIGSESISPLLKLLHVDNRKAQFWAAWAMSFLDPGQVDEQAIECLKQHREQPDSPIEAFAAEEALAKVLARKIQS
ncbi:HEAT repeats [Paenibacillus algorifonticola]|uniref:HEAT repeats n=1 Tax=Paenibacillus algorifonticola TaxID=684063 RepID=A0A1I2IMT0_9BACL|nr:HEAT repeat domain-containing protein [Paenibacillus algorifonticola]SFF42347.1 HEAT repeats [Paenibacillus algorifonticola]